MERLMACWDCRQDLASVDQVGGRGFGACSQGLCVHRVALIGVCSCG